MSGVNSAVHATQNTLKEDLELKRPLKLINKPPSKIIHTESGYIVDCIDIKKQPAFEHPLLKNHTLQRKPSFHIPMDKPMFGLDKEECPTGTVPIRRTTKEDLIREKSLLNYSIMVEGNPGVHLAEVALSSEYGPYYGVFGWNSVYNPSVSGSNQMSLSHLWVQNGPTNTINKISAGWHVSPELYGDHDTHVYASWTTDNFHKTGCYNIRCSGFVQTHEKGFIGSRVKDVSTYDGPTINFNISIIQDSSTKNWWLIIGGVDIGYFPAALFSNMSSADEVGWGGRTLTPRGSPSPPMGSGHFPDKTFSHASFFRMISFQDASRQSYGPSEHQLQYFIDNPTCYGLSYYGNLKGNAGYSFEFGGPGGNCGD
ncbi:unnamed protein product [Sphenostylis stenocarpa]|uniref:Neprosin PEP catalytic domain-containing protein n=1 Tax=Sphenostylis stenocarpa TaxID=92480 RepID=A0AA86W0B6_9FABA|nr:unnamed protein product [Sphenostylis stenocarpa]